MTTRRSFLAGILAGAAAPAIVRASSLMKIWVPSQDLIRGDCRAVATGDPTIVVDGFTSYAVVRRDGTVERHVNDALIEMILAAGKILDAQNVPIRGRTVWTPDGIFQRP